MNITYSSLSHPLHLDNQVLNHNVGNIPNMSHPDIESHNLFLYIDNFFKKLRIYK